MMLLKRALFGVLQCSSSFKKPIILHILYIIVAPRDFYKYIVLRSAACCDWPDIWCAVIGQISGVL